MLNIKIFVLSCYALLANTSLCLVPPECEPGGPEGVVYEVEAGPGHHGHGLPQLHPLVPGGEEQVHQGGVGVGEGGGVGGRSQPGGRWRWRRRRGRGGDGGGGGGGEGEGMEVEE